jgi:hypothetical protein
MTRARMRSTKKLHLLERRSRKRLPPRRRGAATTTTQARTRSQQQKGKVGRWQGQKTPIATIGVFCVLIDECDRSKTWSSSCSFETHKVNPQGSSTSGHR